MFVLSLALVLSVAAPSIAQALPQQHETTEEHEEHGEHAGHLNEVALLLGGTYLDHEHHFTSGFEYVRRLHPYVGVGGAVEYLDGGTWVYVFPVMVYPVAGLKVMAGPGFERHHGDNKFLFRVGVGYAFELSERLSLQPALDVDFIGRERALVYGVVLGFGF